jgi:hypothetical protein
MQEARLIEEKQPWKQLSLSTNLKFCKDKGGGKQELDRAQA